MLARWLFKLYFHFPCLNMVVLIDIEKKRKERCCLHIPGQLKYAGKTWYCVDQIVSEVKHKCFTSFKWEIWSSPRPNTTSLKVKIISLSITCFRSFLQEFKLLGWSCFRHSDVQPMNFFSNTGISNGEINCLAYSNYIFK